MKISNEQLQKEATTTGFRPEILEKVWHLMTILNAVNEHFFLSGKLVLKGGTALNLFIFDLPRLSVDIDFNYIGQTDRDAMLRERPLIENRKFLKAQSDWLAWTNQLLNGCRKALCALFPLLENEREFLDKLHDHGILEASLLTTDGDMIEKINSHPLLKWKVQLVLQNKNGS